MIIRQICLPLAILLIMRAAALSAQETAGKAPIPDAAAQKDNYPEGQTSGKGDKPRRLWTDRSGKHRIEAEFVSLEHGMVRLRKTSGQVISVAIEQLSEKDQTWVQGRVRQEQAARKKLHATAPDPLVTELDPSWTPIAGRTLKEQFMFLPNSRTFVWATRKQVQVCSLPKPKLLKSRDTVVGCISLSPDGKLLAVALENGTIQVWNTRSLKTRFGVSGHIGRISKVMFSQDGKRLLTLGRIEKYNTPSAIKVWDTAKGKEETTILLEGRSRAATMGLSPEGDILIVGGGDRVAFYSTKNWEKIKELPAQGGYVRSITQFVYSPDGKTVVGIGGPGISQEYVEFWDVPAMEQRFRVQNPLSQGEVNCLAFSPDSEICVMGWGGRLVLWNVSSGRQIRVLKGHDSVVTDCTFSSNGQLLLSSSLDWTVRVWDPVSGKEKLKVEGHKAPVYGMLFSPDEKYLVTFGRDRPKVWDFSAILAKARLHEKKDQQDEP